MLLHNLTLWFKKALTAYRASDRVVIRMDPLQRLQHFILAISFFALAITGFGLKYPDSWIAWVIGSDETFRRLTHRIAGLVLIALGI